MTSESSSAPTTGLDIRGALDDVAGIGPFFAVTANPAEAVDDSWRPMSELYSDPEPLAARIRKVADALGVTDSDADRRVAASITYQGLVARLVSPLIAVAAVHRLVPPWSPDSLHWRVSVVGPWPLWEADQRACRPADGDLADAVADVLLAPHLDALAEAIRRQASVPQRSLRGNAASAVVAAGRLVARTRPSAAATSGRLVRLLLDRAPLSGAGTLADSWAFRRHSCCLYYRVPGGGICGDCVLAGR
ncbi:(2Fe-2S)-binding protein [Pseudonocardia spinosispora]|uniref:(2Fe-2S)-binding protein n=1 Tax=Pseudonocardia spinosispora TaxID=103441 RepID=UPI00041A4E99|nr:(2Fe-2S)-binding protein [Pseudonocardia spinosispora]